MVTNQDVQEDFMMFADIWKFYKEFYNVENTDRYWENVKTESNKISHKYHSKYCDNVLVATMSELYRKVKKEL